jgi:hypothetical protein
MNRSRFTAVAFLIFGLIIAFVTPYSTRGQDKKTPYPTMAPVEQYMMDRDAEIALARTGAPDSISRDATIVVLGRHGYEVAVQGKNGFVCDVERAWGSPFDNPEFWNPKQRGPACYNKEASSPLQVTFLRSKLALDGLSKEQIRERVKAAFDKKEISPVESGALVFMMGKGAYLSDRVLTADGAHNVAHLMFFTPRINPSDWGANLDNSPVSFDPARKNDPEPFDLYAILTGMWSDGTPAPLQ